MRSNTRIVLERQYRPRTSGISESEKGRRWKVIGDRVNVLTVRGDTDGGGGGRMEREREKGERKGRGERERGKGERKGREERESGR
jgi:hypothetical protein